MESRAKATGKTTKQKKQLNIMQFDVFVKAFPPATPQEVLAIVRAFEPTHRELLLNLQNLRLYKQQLATYLQQNWGSALHFIQSVTVKMSKRTTKLLEEKQKKIVQLTQMNKVLQSAQHTWQEEIARLLALREAQRSQLLAAEVEVECLNREMREVYRVLDRDMERAVEQLSRKEEAVVQRNKESDMMRSVGQLSGLLSGLEQEHRMADKSLETMRELIKAMARCTKTSTSTQVEESELQTRAGTIFMPPQSTPSSFEIVDGCSLHVLDALRMKEKEIAPEPPTLEKHAEKPWTLTPALNTFLENMLRENQVGKVVPWDHMRGVITDIYAQRIANEQEIFSGGIGNAMQFDQFVVLYFIQKHSSRRLAQKKLLQFIISLKYYSKFWQRAQLFCLLLRITHYTPLFQMSTGFPYDFDFNTQNFFFSLYRSIIRLPQHQDQGAVYVPTASARKLMKTALFFAEQIRTSRLSAKLEKDQRIFDRVQCCDVDNALLLMVDEYLATKKKNSLQLSKAFSKHMEAVKAHFNLEDIRQVVACLPLATAEKVVQVLPAQSKMQVAKLYMYSVTSGKNNYEINCNHFVTACQRFGFDAPYPFLHNCSKLKQDSALPLYSLQVHSLQSVGMEQCNPQHHVEDNRGQSNEKQGNKQSNEKQGNKQQSNEKQGNKQSNGKQGNKQSNEKQGDKISRIAAQRIEVGAKLFGQHFAILRELKGYVEIFTKTLREQKDPEILWRSFGEITTVLQKGCQFMKYPLVSKAKLSQNTQIKSQ